MLTVKKLREFLSTIPDEVEVSFGNEHQSGELELWYKNGDRGFVTNEGRFVPKASIGTAVLMSTKEVVSDVTAILQDHLGPVGRRKHPHKK